MSIPLLGRIYCIIEIQKFCRIQYRDKCIEVLCSIQYTYNRTQVGPAARTEQDLGIRLLRCHPEGSLSETMSPIILPLFLLPTSSPLRGCVCNNDPNYPTFPRNVPRDSDRDAPGRGPGGTRQLGVHLLCIW